jgi:hypothetical protein
MKFFRRNVFVLDSVFHCISLPFFIVKFLKYPVKKHLDDKYQKQVRYIITFNNGINPSSIYFAYQLIEQKNTNIKVDILWKMSLLIKGLLFYTKNKL